MNTASSDTPHAIQNHAEFQRSPRDAFHFCPRCGCNQLGGEHHRAIKCGVCGFQFYFNTGTASAAFIFIGEELILCTRAREPGKGKLDLPGGFLEYDETIEAGLQREIREELNIETDDYQYLTSAPNDYLYAGILYKIADVFFTCTTQNIDSIMAADDVADYQLVRPEQVNPDEFAFKSTRAAFQQLLMRAPRGRGLSGSC